MSAKVADLPLAATAVGAKLYADQGGVDTRVEGGAANGVATLDEAGKLPVSQPPAAADVRAAVPYSGADISSAAIPGAATVDDALAGLDGDISALNAESFSIPISGPEGTAGYVSRNLKSKLRDVISVRDFGAVGNGTTNDTAAFTAAGATGLPVWVPQGSYNLTSFVSGTFICDGPLTFTGVGYVFARNIRDSTYRVQTSNLALPRFLEGGGGSIGTGGTARAVNETYTLKTESEAPFDAVAVALMSYENLATNSWKAVVAATETFSTASQDSRYRPVVGGVTYNSLRGAADYGWDSVTWSGASTINIPGGATNASPAVVLSDFMPINSVPRADGGTRPLVLMRVHHDGSTNGSHTFAQRNFAPWLTASANNRGRLFDIGTFAGDAVGTLSSSITITDKSFLMFPVFRYRSNVVTVAAVGDSISQGLGSATGLDNWVRRACYDLSTSARPIVPMNVGMSSATTVTFLSHGKIVLSLTRPNIAFYSPHSPNDNINTNRGVQNAMARAADFISFCQSNRIVPILSTPTPRNDLTADDVYRRQIRDAVRAMGTAGQCIVADFAAATGDGAIPERWLAGLNFDNIHPNDAGYDAMAAVARQAIVRALNGI